MAEELSSEIFITIVVHQVMVVRVVIVCGTSGRRTNLLSTSGKDALQKVLIALSEEELVHSTLIVVRDVFLLANIIGILVCCRHLS